MDGSRRTRQFGIARRFGSRARKTGRLAHFPSAALTRTRSATRRTPAGARATELATQTPSGWMTAGSRPTKQFGIVRSSVLVVPMFRLTPMPAMSLLPMFQQTPRAAPMLRQPPRARRQGNLANRPCVALSLMRSATRRMIGGARATKLATQTVSGRWIMDGSRRTRQFGIARRFGRRARRSGRLAHLPSAALILARSATRRMTTGSRATKLATQTPCGRRTGGSRRTRLFGIVVNILSMNQRPRRICGTGCIACSGGSST